jgi:hypothetical protein
MQNMHELMHKANDIYTNILNDLVSSLNPVSLAEMDSVKLMDRTDSKFVLSFNELAPILHDIADQYRILTINKTRLFSYRTDYFDTPELSMFADHHNGKLNRFKIRQREYIESNIRFLEVKFKSNKGRVIKDRIEKSFMDQRAFSGFVTGHTPYDPNKLDIILTNQFNRFTLVNLKIKERVTVDFNLVFSDMKHATTLNGLVIIEIKQSHFNTQSPIYKALKQHHIRKESVSKYCLGVSLLSRHPKLNNFKKTLNIVNKLSHVEISA